MGWSDQRAECKGMEDLGDRQNLHRIQPPIVLGILGILLNIPLTAAPRVVVAL